jgi:CxxC motif-containing protein (DUF1111 family)
MDGRVGRFGWKADVPSIREFNRDALSNEMGLTLPFEGDFTFGFHTDTDAIADPEVFGTDLRNLNFFMLFLGPPPRSGDPNDPLVVQGQQVFASVGCTKCHTPSMPGSFDNTRVDVPLYSDLLLHTILPGNSPGIEDNTAGIRDFRTAPLWGLSRSAPYFHSGEADTIDQAIELHAGEAIGVIFAFNQLSAEDRNALMAFLRSL